MNHLLERRWRLVAAVGVGGLAGALAGRGGMPLGQSVLVGWNAAAALWMAAVLTLILTSAPEEVRRRARREDEDRFVLSGVVLAAVGLSLLAIVFALREAKGHGPGQGQTALALSITTLVLSWGVVVCLYTLHYAHRYFGDRDDDGRPDGGIQFPGDPPDCYKDFLYVAVCVAATAQVSDVSITATKYRNLVTSQALVAFFFNTMVLALGINIIASLLGQ